MSSHKIRTAVAAGALAVTAGGAIVIPALADGAAPCFAYTDPKGDALIGLPAAAAAADSNDPDVDTVGVGFKASDTTFTASVTVATLGTSDAHADSEVWQSSFTVAGKAVIVRVRRRVGGLSAVFDTVAPNSMGKVAMQESVTVDGTVTSIVVKPAYDTATNTVNMSFPIADFKSALGGVDPSHATLSKLSGLSEAVIGAAVTNIDNSAPAAAATYVVGSCESGSAGGDPSATDTPTGDPGSTDTATPDPSSTDTPTSDPSSTDTPTDDPSATDGPTPVATDFPGFDVPRDGCTDYTDAPGDSKAMLLGKVPYPGTDPDTEITAATHHSTAASLIDFIKVATLGATGPATTGADGDTFTWNFTAEGKKLVVSAGRAAGKATAPTLTIDGKADATVKPTATYDTKTNLVILTLDRPALEAALGAPLTKNTPLTAMSESSTWIDKAGQSTPSDTAQGAGDAASYQVDGADSCFFPPAGALTVTNVSTRYNNTISIPVTLLDSAQAAVAGNPVDVTFNGHTTTVTTDDAGKATAAFPAPSKIGNFAVSARFGGTDTVGKASATGKVTVAIQPTKITLSVVNTGTTRTIKATLKDADGRPLSAQGILFSFHGKVASATTSSAGLASITKVAPATTVTATYYGSTGKYASTKATVKI